MIIQTVACQVVYEPRFEWWFPAAGLLVAVGAAVMALLMSAWKRIFGFSVAGLALLTTVGAGADVYGDFKRARAAADSPSTPMVQGSVQEFQPAPWEGHQNESFRVSGMRFSYSDFVITGGFRQTSSHGGPIRSGLNVRIRYLDYGKVIVKLEVCPSG